MINLNKYTTGEREAIANFMHDLSHIMFDSLPAKDVEEEKPRPEADIMKVMEDILKKRFYEEKTPQGERVKWYSIIRK